MIDPHGEYSAAFKGCGELFNVDNLQLPYWLMNFEEHCEVLLTTQGAERQRDADILAKCLLAARTKGKNLEQLGKVTVDSPIPYLLTDLNTILVNEMGKLDRAGDTAPFQRLKTKLDELRADPRYTFMFSGMLVVGLDGRASSPSCSACPATASRSRSSTCRAFRPTSPRWWSRCSRGWCSTMRSGRGPRRSARCCWSARRRTATFPRTRTPSGQAVRKILERIAKEGRKYGVSLGLITQRPSDLAEGVLSQCGTIIAMRLNNDRDQACVRAAMPEGARGFLDAIPALAQPRMHRLRRRRRDPDPRPLRRPRAREAPGLVRPELRRAVARDRRRGRHHPAAPSSAGAGTAAKRHPASLDADAASRRCRDRRHPWRRAFDRRSWSMLPSREACDVRPYP